MDDRREGHPGKSSLAGALILSALVHLAVLTPPVFRQSMPVRATAPAPLLLDLRQIDFYPSSPPSPPKAASPPEAPAKLPASVRKTPVRSGPEPPPRAGIAPEPDEPPPPVAPAGPPVLPKPSVPVPEPAPGFSVAADPNETPSPAKGEENSSAADEGIRGAQAGAAGPLGTAENSLSDDQARRAYLTELKRLIEQHRDYPALARRSRMQGKVLVRALLARDGTLLDAGIDVSSGIPMLDRAALRALREVGQYPPIPAEIAGEAVFLFVPVSYRLQAK